MFQIIKHISALEKNNPNKHKRLFLRNDFYARKKKVFKKRKKERKNRNTITDAKTKSLDAGLYQTNVREIICKWRKLGGKPLQKWPAIQSSITRGHKKTQMHLKNCRTHFPQ